MPPPPISRRGVLGLSAAAAVVAASAVAVPAAMAEEPDGSKESKDVKPMVIECLADLNRRSA
ncbi:MAG: hypothetical protein ACRD0P_19705 [Stackebrandtia sp.]